MDVLLSISRWLHISAVMVLGGGLFYARVVTKDLAAGFKPWGYGAIGAILVSGLVNILSKPPLPLHYYVWFGIKILLALHVFGVVVRSPGKPRLLTGAVITLLAILAISEVLRSISLPSAIQ
jgi:hypothetical protein